MDYPAISLSFYAASATNQTRKEGKTKKPKIMGNPGRKGGAGGDSDLHAAARSGNMQAVRSICSSNPLSVNSRDKLSRTPMVLAEGESSKGGVFYLSSMLPYGIPFFCSCFLYKVIPSSDVHRGEELEQSAVPFVSRNCFGPVFTSVPDYHFAAWSGQTEVVSYLCKHKADVGAAAMDDMGAIHFAAQKGHLEVVRVLLSSGVSLKASNRKGFTALHYAAQGSHMELVNYLIRKGASLTAKTKAGKTPLDLANGEEVQAFLSECDLPAKKVEAPKDKEKSEEVNPKPSEEEGEDKAVHSSDVAATGHTENEHDDDDDGKVKRNVEGTDIAANSSKRKKASGVESSSS